MYYFKLVMIKRLRSEIATSFCQAPLPEKIAKRRACRPGIIVCKSIRDCIEYMTRQYAVSCWERSKILNTFKMYTSFIGGTVTVVTTPIAVYVTNGSPDIKKFSECSRLYESSSELHFTLIGMLDVKTFMETGKIVLTDDQEPAEIDDTRYVEPDNFDIEGYLKEHKIEVK